MCPGHNVPLVIPGMVVWLKSMFGDQQMSSLADYIQAALMLAYNGRRIG